MQSHAAKLSLFGYHWGAIAFVHTDYEVKSQMRKKCKHTNNMQHKFCTVSSIKLLIYSIQISADGRLVPWCQKNKGFETRMG